MFLDIEDETGPFKGTNTSENVGIVQRMVLVGTSMTFVETSIIIIMALTEDD